MREVTVGRKHIMIIGKPDECLENYYRILSQNKRIPMNSKSNNANMLVIGNSGSGKDLNVWLPNFLCASKNSMYPGNMVIIDSMGDRMYRTKRMFENRGYNVIVIEEENILEKDYNWSCLTEEEARTVIYLHDNSYICDNEQNKKFEKISRDILTYLYSICEEYGKLPVPITFWVECESMFFFSDDIFDICKKIQKIEQSNVYFSYSMQVIERIKYNKDIKGEEILDCILNNCDNIVYLGSFSGETTKLIREQCNNVVSENDLIYMIEHDACLVISKFYNNGKISEKCIGFDKKFDTFKSPLFKKIEHGWEKK